MEWDCLYFYRVTGRRLPFVGLYRHKKSGEKHVVRLLVLAKATAYDGTDTEEFVRIPGVRPDKVFRTIFTTEGDPTFSLKIINSSSDDIPDLGIENLRQELTDD